MKKFLSSIVLLAGLSFLSYCYGQDSIVKNVKRTEIEKPNTIFFAPLNLLDFINPNFQIGYERLIAKRWALQVECGIIINHSIENYLIDFLSGIKDCPYTNKGIRLRGSVKYVFIDKRKVKMYLSPELFYLRNKSGIAGDFLKSDSDFEYSFEPAPEWADGYTQFFYNDEEKMGVNFKVGVKLLGGKRFFMDTHWGLGFAYRNVVQTEIENPNDKYEALFGIFDNAVPNKWVPTIPINFKIGFRF